MRRTGFIDYVPPEKETCKNLNVLAPDCEKLHECFVRTLNLMDECCICYKPIPVYGAPSRKWCNSNCTAYWLLVNCLDRKFLPDAPVLPPGLKTAPGWRKKLPKCISNPPKEDDSSGKGNVSTNQECACMA